WHLDVVEDHEGVLLVEAGGQRAVEGVRARGGGAVPAQEDQPGRVDGDGEGQGVAGGVGGDGQRGGDGELGGERGQRGEDGRAAHHDARRGVRHLVERDAVADDARVRRLVDGGLDDGVGEGDVVLREVPLERDEVLRALLVAAVGAGPHPVARREAGELHVHV